MKTNGFVNSKRIFSALAIVALLVCALCVFASANDAELKVGNTNLKYDTYTHIIVTLEGEPAAGALKGIAVWTPDVEEPTAENVSYFNFVEETDPKGVKFFATRGIPASELSETFYIAPAVRDANGNESVAGEIVERSAFGYVEERLGDDNLKGYQVNIYRDLVVYGTAAEQVLGDATANRNVVVAANGYVGNAVSPLQFATGETALLRAPVQNAKGEYFAYWADAFGNFVTGERLATVDVKAGLNWYNAVYTTKSASAYGGFADLQALSLGAVNYTINTADLTDGQKNGASALNRFSFYPAGSPIVGEIWAASKLDVTDLTLATLPVLDQDEIIVSAAYDGTKSVRWNKHVVYDNGSTYKYVETSLVNSTSYDGRTSYDRFEIDLQIAGSGYFPTVYVYFWTPSGSRLGTYFNISRGNNADGESCLRFVYPTDAGSIDLLIPDNGGKEIVTIGYEVDENGYCMIFINGEKLESESPVKYFAGTRAPGDYYPGQVTLEATKVGSCDYTVYGVGLVDTDLTKKN